jgi:hypothetical protein
MYIILKNKTVLGHKKTWKSIRLPSVDDRRRWWVVVIVVVAAVVVVVVK